MAHKAQKDFCKRVKACYPEYFQHSFVLDCGSYDINGNNWHLFEHCRCTGIDLIAGPCVDIVSKIHEYRAGEHGLYDTIISTECFEHDKYFQLSIQRIVELLKPSGLFLFTCATDGRVEHGTVNNLGWASPGTVQMGDGWESYYRNIPPAEALEIGMKYFTRFSVEVDQDAHDLYFWGIK